MRTDHSPFRPLVLLVALLAFGAQAFASTPAGAVASSTAQRSPAAVAPVQVAGGQNHTCGLRADGTVACWGSNTSGQVTPPAGTFTAISAGAANTCAVRADQSLQCWGSNTLGQSSPTPSGSFTAVSAGAFHGCAIRTDQTLACWDSSGSPQATPPAGTFISVSAGGTHSCGVRTDNTVTCWGNNSSGQAPASVAGTFTKVAAGTNHTCGLRTTGAVTCWGSNTSGQATAPAGTFTAITAGQLHSCGIRTDKTVKCWGSNASGQRTEPAGSFASISAGSTHTCAVRTDDTVVCWGFNSFGQITPPAAGFVNASVGQQHTCAIRSDTSVACWGDNTSGQSTPASGSFLAVSAGGTHTCGIRSDSTVTCWGNNTFGQSNASAGSFSSLSAGESHTCGVRTDNSVHCWGNNGNGQATDPVGTFLSVSAGGSHTCGVKTDNSVTCWGNNSSGQAPASVLGSFLSVSAGGGHSCGVKTDNTVACWGLNGDGQAGPPGGTFKSVSAGFNHTCGVRTNDTLTCWGSDANGKATAPAGSYSNVSSGFTHTCGVRTDGVFQCWGERAALGGAMGGSGVPTPGDLFTAQAPVRIQDSRPASKVGPYATPWGAATTRDVTVVGGATGVPAGADAVVLNVTVTDTTGPSYLTIWPKGAAKPLASSLNWVPGWTIPNAVTVKVGDADAISVYNNVGSVNVIIDVVGYYKPATGAGFTGQAPVRIQDSRLPFPIGPYNTPWPDKTTRDITVTGGSTGVPAGADAVVLNVTVTDTTDPSYLTIWPKNESKPVASSLNWVPGWTIPNAVTVKVGAAGAISVYNNAGSVHVIIDVVGYYKSGTGSPFHPLSPARIQDSRPDSQVGPYSSPWVSTTQRDITITGDASGVPSNAAAALLNFTVTDTTGASYLTVWPKGGAKPLASSLNWVPGWTIPNAVTAKIDAATGKVAVYNNNGAANVIADVNGWFG